MIPDKCILQAMVRISALDLMHGDDKYLQHTVENQLRLSLAEELRKVGTRTEEQTPDGLAIRHEVLVFSRADFYRIVREEAQALYHRALYHVPHA